jgi:hypothetical protein
LEREIFSFFCFFAILIYRIEGMKMTKLEKKKVTVYVVGIILIVIVIIGGGILLFKPKSDETIDNVGSTGTLPHVEPEEAENMYSEIANVCTGAMVWNLELGQTVEINNLADNTDACKTDNYYSKMLGYYDIEDGVVIHVNVLKRVDDNMYKLNDTLVGAYDDDKLDALLDAGTTYSYTYKKDGEDYKLVQVELMDDTVPEETEEETIEEETEPEEDTSSTEENGESVDNTEEE